MLRRLSVTGFLLLLLTAHSPSAAAQTSAPSPDETRTACRNRMFKELAAVHDEYRSVIFGSIQDKDGNVVVKGGGSGTVVRQGILEERGRLTSELVAPIMESYRAYRCRSLAVCKVLQESFSHTNMKEAVQVHTLGCQPQEIEPYEECFFGTAKNAKARLPQSDVQALGTECDVLVQDTLTMERAVLRTAVAYDSGYRGLLQFSGMMNMLLDATARFAFPPLRDMINLLGKLHQIPCYIGQCDMRKDLR